MEDRVGKSAIDPPATNTSRKVESRVLSGWAVIQALRSDGCCLCSEQIEYGIGVAGSIHCGQHLKWELSPRPIIGFAEWREVLALGACAEIFFLADLLISTQYRGIATRFLIRC